MHEKKKPFECSICNKKFTQKGHMNGHIASVHNEMKRYECNLCTLKYSNQSGLKYHIASVHEKKNQLNAAYAIKGSLKNLT